MNPFPHVPRATRRSFVRTTTSVGLCALLMLNGVSASGPNSVSASGLAKPFPRSGRLGRMPARSVSASSVIPQDPVGCGIQPSDAARFLEQGTFGPSFTIDPLNANYRVSVAHVMNDVCFEGWLLEQFNAPVLYPDDPTVPNMGTNYVYPGDAGVCDDAAAGGYICWSPQNPATSCTNNSPSTCNRDNYTAYQLQNQFFVNALTGADQLRQRVAFALSEIYVVSLNSNIAFGYPRGPANYLDMLGTHAFGNFRNLIEAVTYSPMMGLYLSHLRNQKENASSGSVPDENYAPAELASLAQTHGGA